VALRSAILPAIATVLWLTGCGYVGPVLPPSPDIPATVTDLTVVERGDQLVIAFHAQPHTTDGITIKRFTALDLRVGQNSEPFDYDRWAGQAKAYEPSLPPKIDPDDPHPATISFSLPVADWVGQDVSIAVRASMKKSGHFSAWSNRIRLKVVEPLAPPVVEATPTADGYKLTWPEQRTGLHYQIYRRGPTDKTAVDLGTAEKPEFIDATSQWDTPYSYTVVAVEGGAESLPSAPKDVNAPDTFPPPVTASVVALPGADSIDVSWSRSTASDFKGYYIYRSVNGGAFERQGGLTNLPTYGDRSVEHGKSYRYTVTAVDQKSNESARSPIAEAVFP
jgi:predicted small lipoprotein YifL